MAMSMPSDPLVKPSLQLACFLKEKQGSETLAT